jgi:hypothetical protein
VHRLGRRRPRRRRGRRGLGRLPHGVSRLRISRSRPRVETGEATWLD